MRYLSDEWFSAANMSIAAHVPPCPYRLVIDQHISETPTDLAGDRTAGDRTAGHSSAGDGSASDISRRSGSATSRTVDRLAGENRGATHSGASGQISWRVNLDPNGSSLTRLGHDSSADTEPADAAFYQSYQTARSVARGTTNAHQAFLLGEIRFEGSIDSLIDSRDALIWLEQALGPVMRRAVL